MNPMIKKAGLGLAAITAIGLMGAGIHHGYQNSIVSQEPMGEPWVETQTEGCHHYGYCYAYDYSRSKYRYHYNSRCDGKREATREYQKYRGTQRDGDRVTFVSDRLIEATQCR